MHILADIGGTKMRMAASTDFISFTEPAILDTPASYEAGIALIVETALRFSKGEEIAAIALGMPGVIVPDKQCLHDSNMPAWDGKPIVEDIAKTLRARVFAVNDTALVGLGEAHFGAGKGASVMVYMTISTGVNAARIANDAIDPGVYGSETGEQYIFINGEAKHLGDVISGKAVREKYGVAPRDLGKDSPVWEELARYAAYGVYNSIVHWSPRRVVIGGSMVNDIGISVDRIRAHVETLNRKYPTLPEIVHAELGDIGGLYGGLVLLREKMHTR